MSVFEFGFGRAAGTDYAVQQQRGDGRIREIRAQNSKCHTAICLSIASWADCACVIVCASTAELSLCLLACPCFGRVANCHSTANTLHCRGIELNLMLLLLILIYAAAFWLPFCLQIDDIVPVR